MARSLFTRLILASVALSWAASATNQLDLDSVATTDEVNEPTDLELLANIRNTEDIQDADVDEAELTRRKNWWRPTDATFQIILSKVMLPNPENNTRKPPQIEPSYASVFEVDLFDTPASTMRAMKRAGKKVICYFSAGTSEDWRPDYKEFTAADKGLCLPEWAGKNNATPALIRRKGRVGIGDRVYSNPSLTESKMSVLERTQLFQPALCLSHR